MIYVTYTLCILSVCNHILFEETVSKTNFVSSWCVNLIRVFLHDDTLH